MNFIDAVGDWKSNDEWRYADKEAAWKFFFAAGKESSQAVISAQCVKMSQYESIIFELRKQLTARVRELEEENARPIREVVNRNQRALNGDKAVKAADALYEQLASAEQRVAEAIVDMLQQKHRNCFGAHSFYLAASVATANGEWRKFVKEV